MLKMGLYDSMGSISDSSFPARLTTTTSMLNNTLPALYDSYAKQITNSSSLIQQKDSLQSSVKSLQVKKKDIDTSSDTYHREFLDRTTGTTRGFFQRFGISTLQDWLILILYVLYGSICIIVFIIAVVASPQKILAGFAILSTSIFMGIMITGIIIRYG
jgi:hypothetical protein